MSKYQRIIIFTVFISLFLLLFVCTAYAEGNAVTGMIWIDANANGIYETDEKHYGDAKVYLQQPSGNDGYDIEECKVSDRGEFSFSDVPDGDYRLKIVTGGFSFTTAFMESDALPSVGTTGYTDWKHIDEDQRFMIGVVKTSNKVRIIAYKDEDSNGGRRKSEKLIRGVQFALIYEKDGIEHEVATIESTSNSNSFAEFEKVTPGKYKMKMTVPDGYASTVINKDVFTQWYNAFPPTDADIIYTGEFEVVAREDIGMCAGLVPACGVSGRIWDSDHDAPVSGATVSLYEKEYKTQYISATDENGYYSFDRIIAANYKMSLQLPDGKAFSRDGLPMRYDQNESGDAVCDVKIKSGNYVELDDILTIDDTVIIIKADWSGVFEDDGFDTTKVSYSLRDSNNSIISSGTFDNGTVKVRGLNDDAYTVSFNFSEGYVADFSMGDQTETAGRGDKLDITVEKGINESIVVFARSCSISGFVFEDVNNDGSMDSNETMVPGLTVIAVDSDGVICGETVTDAAGAYDINGLMPGVYKIRFIAADPYVAANAGTGHAIVLQTPDYGETDSINLDAGEEITRINGAVFCAHSVSGHADVCDERMNNIAGNAANVKAALYCSDGSPVSDFSYDISDNNGDYSIKGVLPGEYYIVYSIPENYLFTNPYSEEYELRTDIFTVIDDVQMPDIAVLPCGSISGCAMHGNEPVEFSVTLRGSLRNNIIEVKTTDDAHFENPRILPDTYQVTYSLDEGYVFGEGTSEMIGCMNSNSYETTIEIGVGQIISGLNIDAVMTGTVNGYVFYDYSGDGDALNTLNMPFDKETEVSLIRNGETVDTTVTGSNGGFIFEKVIPGDYQILLNTDECTRITNPSQEKITLYVCDGDNDVSVEIGLVKLSSISGSVWNIGNSTGAIAGIHVYLYNEYTNGPVADCYTDENGYFVFRELKPDNYYLAADLPDGYLFAKRSDAISHDSYVTYDSDPEIITLKMGDERQECDIGIGAPGSIGDYAWLDLNANGLFDIGEPQLPGIRIEMFMGDELAAETYSDEYGYWEFTDMYPGEYTLKVYMPPEVKTTVYNAEFPNVNSILPSDMTGIVEVKVIVPSNDRNSACDLGFTCIEDGVLPDAVKDLPSIDWSFNGTKRYDFDKQS